MKRLKYIFPALLLGLSLLTSCAPEEDTGPEDDRTQFIDSWTVNENSSLTGSNPPYTVHINLGSGTDDVTIENFYGLGFQNKALATITVNDIDIANQPLAGNTTHGGGNISGNTISMTYYVDDGASVDTINATFTRQ